MNVQATTDQHQSVLSADEIRALLSRSNAEASVYMPEAYNEVQNSAALTSAPIHPVVAATTQINQYHISTQIVQHNNNTNADTNRREDGSVRPQYGRARKYKQFDQAKDPSFDLRQLAIHNMGQMNVICPFCQALHWDCERLSNSSKTHPKFGTCCLSGKIILPTQPSPPQELKILFSGNTEESKNFLQHIREYNAAFAFTSLGVKTVELSGHGPYVFKVQGALSHRIGSLLPDANQNATYAQLYFYDSRDALNI